MCVRCKVFLKSLINILYLFTMIVGIELFSLLPGVSRAYTINTGSAIDLGLNVIATILSFCIVILWAKFLFSSIRRYKTNLNSRKTTKCSAFNPFC